MIWMRQYLAIENKDDGLDWRLQYGNWFEIVGEIEDFYFLWAAGTSIAFPKSGKYKYKIKREEINTE